MIMNLIYQEDSLLKNNLNLFNNMRKVLVILLQWYKNIKKKFLLNKFDEFDEGTAIAKVAKDKGSIPKN